MRLCSLFRGVPRFHSASLLRCVSLILACCMTGPAAGQMGVFSLERLPPGKSVTIPRPATTSVPLSSRVSLSSTDMPQSLSFKAINPAGGAVLPLRIALYDKHQERVQYIDIRPNTPALYSFKEIGSIIVVPDQQKNKGASYAQMRLVVESNKPLEIAR